MFVIKQWSDRRGRTREVFGLTYPDPPLPPHAEDGHRGGDRRRRRLSVAVSVTPENDRLHGSLTHLGGETLAGREMELNKVTPEVTVRPVPPPQQPVTVGALKTQESEPIVHLQDRVGQQQFSENS